MTKNKNSPMFTLKIIEVNELEDGTSEMILDIPSEFQEWFKKEQGLKRWSNKRFQAWLEDAIEKNLLDL
ncbi:hypothetical protein CMI41_01025 [Candidatus Pacearchaeota archaeon]|jgi:hypothetical protein|nr:hypothetical protein [Candidatus Pacearchaeota archaeon]|tara:strand:- start:18549 stop:18755 length:207 start_codon:yes stop_codon:yes gene_type:complete